MKKAILLSVLFLSYFTQAQITLEKTLPVNERWLPFTASNDFSYISYDSNSIKLYNSDYILLKKVTIPMTDNCLFYFFCSGTDYQYYDLKASKYLFNNDDKYEFIVFIGDKTKHNNYIKAIVINEDSEVIFDFSYPDENYYYENHYIFHDKFSKRNKIIITYFSIDNVSSVQQVFTLPSTSLSLSETPKMTETKRKLFPIPTKSLLTFRNPENGSKAIEVFDVTGKLVLTKEFGVSDEDVTVNVEALTNGTYILKSGSYSTKFIKE